MNSLLTSLQIFLPVAHAWAEKQEVIILDGGIPLTEVQLADARKAGVTYPEKIRLMPVETLPQPENEDAMFVAKHIGLFSEKSVSLTLGYGIYIQQDFLHDRPKLVHEFVHVSQYEKLDGIRPFLNAYLRECIEPGYPFGRMEQEAILVARDICRHSDDAAPA
jgi:hypothetical protein